MQGGHPAVVWQKVLRSYVVKAWSGVKNSRCIIIMEEGEC